MTRLTIVFDNYAYLEGFPTLWGFSCFVETPETTFLFDTGSNGRVLLRNMERLGIDPQRAKALILSHPHWDHIGGVDSVLEVHPNLKIFAPTSLSRHLIRDLASQSLGVTVIGEDPVEILPGVWSTGIMGEIGEQSVAVDTEKGPVVLTGCAHPGVEKISERAAEMLEEPIHLLLGGFHLMYSDAAKIVSVIERLKALKVQNVCPTHCSGDLAIRLFSEAFGKGFIRGGAGRCIEI